MKRFIKNILKAVLLLISTGLIFLLGINFYIKKTTDSRIISSESAAKLEDVDCILVLGAGVKSDKTPSLMLGERLDSGISLYQSGASPKLLMSGDHRQDNYNEVQVMKDYAIDAGMPSSDIFMDHAGVSTYDSVYRTKEIFQAKKVIIVSQEYHLYRALYLAKSLGIEAYGVAADTQRYKGQAWRDFREVLARDKDFFTAIVKPKPEVLGNTIPVNGNGNVTND